MVPVTPQQLLAGRRRELTDVVHASFGKNQHSDAFALRVLGLAAVRSIVGDVEVDSAIDPTRIHYQGFPGAAYLGFLIAGEALVPGDASPAFISGVERLSARSEASLAAF